jgi:hypothetical protein
MDYEGQKLAELLFYWIIISFGGVGWVIGYIQQDFIYVFYAWSVGVVLSVIVSEGAPISPYSYHIRFPLLTIIFFIALAYSTTGIALCTRLAIL